MTSVIPMRHDSVVERVKVGRYILSCIVTLAVFLSVTCPVGHANIFFENPYINNIVADVNIQNELSVREAAALRLKTHLESLILNNTVDALLSQCHDEATDLSQDACGSTLKGGICTRNFGDTFGCRNWRYFVILVVNN